MKLLSPVIISYIYMYLYLLVSKLLSYITLVAENLPVSSAGSSRTLDGVGDMATVAVASKTLVAVVVSTRLLVLLVEPVVVIGFSLTVVNTEFIALILVIPGVAVMTVAVMTVAMFVVEIVALVKLAVALGVIVNSAESDTVITFEVKAPLPLIIVELATAVGFTVETTVVGLVLAVELVAAWSHLP